jgi:hypothetical protein
MSTRPHPSPESQDLGRDRTTVLQDDYGRASAGSQLVAVPTQRRPSFSEPLAVLGHSLAYTDIRPHVVKAGVDQLGRLPRSLLVHQCHDAVHAVLITLVARF